MKNITFRGGIWQKANKEEGLHKKEGLGQFADLRGACQERGGGSFWGAGVDTPMHTTLLDQTEGERKAFLGGSKKGSQIVRLPPRGLDCHKRRKKISPFVKFEVILHLLCFLLHLLTDKLCKAWSSMINLWIDSRTYQK